MLKKLVRWLLFSVIVGLLPLFFKLLVTKMLNISCDESTLYLEIFSFNLVLCVDGLKTLNDVDNSRKAKELLYASLIISVIIMSFLYGILLLNDYKKQGFNLEPVHVCSIIFTAMIVIVDFITQFLGGADDEWVNK